MKKILLIIILSFFICPGVGASEIFGQISTNPNPPPVAPPPVVPNPPSEEPPNENPPSVAPPPVIVNSRGAVILPAPGGQEEQPREIRATTVEPQILGVKYHPDGSLLRGADQKIYLIQGRFKKPVINLEELKKYRGRAILEAAAEELAGYETRGHLDGELIREKGEAKIYVIKKGLKQHILNLEELRAHYFGLEIFNLGREEMTQY